MISVFDFSLLKGKVVVITGGSRGIGKAVADAVIEHGASVVIGDILEQQGESVVKEYNSKAGKKVAAFIRTDVSKYIDNQNLFKLAESEFGGVDHAFLNAGISNNANSMFTPMDDNVEEKVINVNTTAVIKGTKVALLHMAKRGGCSIVTTASAAGIFPSPSLASYNASKHAVVGFTMSFQLMPSICNVRVNAMCPNWVETDIIKSNPGDEKSAFLLEFIDKCPHTPIKIVVDGVLQFFVDSSKNTEIVLALTDGLHKVKKPELPSSISSKGAKEAQIAIYKKLIYDGKLQLAKALEDYGI